MPNLKYFTTRGNTTVYEWRTGNAPKTIEKPTIEYNFGEENSHENEANVEINFDIADEGVLVEVMKFKK